LRQSPGDDKTDVTDAEIDAGFRSRGIEPVYSGDYQLYNAHSAGAMQGWKKQVKIIAYLEGTWSNLDGGDIDFGLVRDSVLNKTNDLQVMTEGFEGIARFGLTSYVLTMDICPDGTTSAPIELTPCAGNQGS
jgi:hypothetical protein